MIIKLESVDYFKIAYTHIIIVQYDDYEVWLIFSIPACNI